LGSASDYAEDPCFNPEGIVLDRQKMENLSRLVAERQDELRRLIDAEWQAIDEIRDYRLANGQYIESPLPSDRKVKDGTVVILRSTSGQPSRMIRIQYGEYAPVDVIVDDMWELVAATQQDIKSYFN